jgi:hypothetical protein
MRLLAMILLLLLMVSCAAKKESVTDASPKFKETCKVSVGKDKKSFFLTWYRFSLDTDLVDKLYQTSELYLRFEWDGVLQVLTNTNFTGVIQSGEGHEYAISQGEIKVVAVHDDYIELDFNISLKRKTGQGAFIEIKERKRFTSEFTSPGLKFEKHDHLLEGLPDSIRALRKNTFSWNDDNPAKDARRINYVFQDFGGPCSTAPCDKFIHNRMMGDSIQHFLFRNPKVKLSLEFHTDTRGSESYNETLSNRMAEATVVYLTRRGVEADRLRWIGHGASAPLVSKEWIEALEDKELQNKLHMFNRRFGECRVVYD